MPDLSEYLGIPFVRGGRERTGTDCYGFVWMLFRDQLGIELPRYEGACTLGKEHEQVQSLIQEHLETSQWIPIRLEDVREFDVLFMKRFGRMHVGVCIGSSKLMHMDKERGVCVDDFRRNLLKGTVEACYRHRSRAA